MPAGRRRGRGLHGSPLARGAVADECEGDRVRALESLAVGQAGGVRGMSGERGALRCGAMTHGFVTAVAVASQQRQRLDGIDVPAHQRHAVTVGGEQPVGRAQGERRADLARLLSEAGRMHRQSALAGERGGLGVEATADDHFPVGREQQFGFRHSVFAVPD